ncbi:MAG: methyltransferase [Alphaproteobacteria bacterium]|nr:MAG: methyltransferase [Alphaproteobacteria bacterium]
MRKALLVSISALSLALGGCMDQGGDAASASAMAPDYSGLIATAVAAPDRPEKARELDADRKPTETLAWLGLKPGMKAADLIPGEGYWTEIMAHVTGPTGSVVGMQPSQFYNSEQAIAAWKALEARAPGSSIVRSPFGQFDYPANSFDFAMFSLNHHDLYWESEQYKIPRINPDDAVRGIFNIMRPGGIVGVIDHAGPSGDTRDVVERLHRIDPAVVIADYERAGFEFVGQSSLLANPDDDHTVNVFNPAIRGKTDRFLLKFRKPG